MDEKLKKIMEVLKTASLSPGEKAAIRERLMLRVRETPNIASPVKPIPSSWLGFNIVRIRELAVVFSLLLVFGAASGGLTALANQALPGELLYPVKISVNERVARFFEIDNLETEVHFETDLLERRLIEAEVLENKNELTLRRKEEIRESIIKQTSRTELAFEKFQKKSPSAAKTPPATTSRNLPKTAPLKPQAEKRNLESAPGSAAFSVAVSAPSNIQIATGTDETLTKSSNVESGGVREVKTPPANFESADFSIVENVFKKHKKIVDVLEIKRSKSR